MSLNTDARPALPLRLAPQETAAPAAWFVALCMAIIAVSLGVVLYTQAGFALGEAGWAAFACLVTMVLAEFYTARLREKARFERELAAIAASTDDISREVGRVAVRLRDAEGEIGRRVRETVDARLGVLLDDVAGLESLVREMAGEIRELKEAQTAPAPAPAPLVATPRAAARPLPETPAPASVATAAPEAARIDPVLAKAIAYGLRNGQIDVHLQPIVALPQRRAVHYEALARLRGTGGEILLPEQILPEARRIELVARVDAAVVGKSLRIAAQAMAREREGLVFCNLDPDSLGAGAARLLETVEAAGATARSLVLEIEAAAFADLGPAEHETIEALVGHGCRFGLDNLSDLAVAGATLQRQHVRFVKVDAKVLLDPEVESGDIHPSDFARLMARSGIEVVATRVERESDVLELLDFDVKLAQGFLFGRPRPVRTGYGASAAARPA